MFFKEKLICNLFHVCWECDKKSDDVVVLETVKHDAIMKMKVGGFPKL